MDALINNNIHTHEVLGYNRVLVFISQMGWV